MNSKSQHTAVESGMSEQDNGQTLIKVAELLDAAGYNALWAKGKGDGFWIEGLGYKSLSQCAELIPELQLTPGERRIVAWLNREQFLEGDELNQFSRRCIGSLAKKGVIEKHSPANGAYYDFSWNWNGQDLYKVD